VVHNVSKHVGELIGSRALPILMYRIVSIYLTMIYVALLVKYDICKRLAVWWCHRLQHFSKRMFHNLYIPDMFRHAISLSITLVQFVKPTFSNKFTTCYCTGVLISP